MDDEIVFSGNRLVEGFETEHEMISTQMESVLKIVYHTPMGEGDRHFADVFYTDGQVHRIFDPKCVIWKEEE